MLEGKCLYVHSPIFLNIGLFENRFLLPFQPIILFAMILEKEYTMVEIALEKRI
jgi:hypothetical protein